MAASPRQPENWQEIWERLYGQLTMYIEARTEGLTYVARVMQRDIETIRGQIAEIAAFQQTMMDAFNGFATDVMKLILALQQQANTTQQQILLILQRLDKQDERMDTIEQTMRDGFASIRLEMETIRQEMRDGFAAQAERHNELMMRVERLERRDNPPPERT